MTILTEKEGVFMSIGPSGVTIYKLSPEKVEELLVAQYGSKITAVNTARLAKLNQRREKFAAPYQESAIKKT